ncbi:MAG TPA: hypothetical protein VK419_01680 [Bryobacteraceae bacterium]|nr:hypothetical protein [Bryobacteraceae bacterium]
MKKYIREMIDDLRKKNPSTKVADLNPPPEPAMPYDLENQILSKNPPERLKQFDFQAQQESELEAEES